MSEQISSALSLLRVVRGRTDSIGVAVSFGKDSLATLDLCCRLFPRVEAYYLYRVANMEIVRDWCDEVYSRHGVVVREYPHFDLSRCYKNAVCQPHWQTLGNVPKIKMSDIESAFRADANVDWIAYGWRRNDSFSRAIIMKHCAGIDFKSRRIFPLRGGWTRGLVYEYLDERNIPRPPTLGRSEQGGLDFHPAALAWLREHYPRDYERWVEAFPFSGVTATQYQRGKLPRAIGQESK